MQYKYRALGVSNKHTIANYYGVKTNQLIDRHYYCYYCKFFISKFLGNYR